MRTRQDRWSSFLNRAEEANISDSDYEPFNAIIGDLVNPPPFWSAGNGAWGCYRSHLGIIEKCLNNGYGSVRIFEDDAIFCEDFNNKFNTCLDALPSDWDMFYIGGQLMHTKSRIPLQINDHICRVYNVNRTHGYCISQSGMEKVYKFLHMTPFQEGFHIDHQLGIFHESHLNKIYAPHEWLVGQHGSSSSVSGRTEPATFYPDPKRFFVDHHLYKNPVCILFRGNPDYVPELRRYLHFGNTVGNDNLDPLLSEAVHRKDPIPKITEWYNWIRSECTKPSMSDKLPAAAHPYLSQEILEQAGITKIYELDSSGGAEGLVEQISKIKTEVRNNNG